MPDAIRIPSLRMTELDGSPDVQGVERIYLTSGFMSSLGGGAVLLSLSGSAGSSVTIRDIDGAPTVTPLNTLYVTNGFLSDLGGGNALLSMSGSASALTVQEIDGSPLVNSVSTIQVTNGSLTDNGGGNVTVQTGAMVLLEETVVGVGGVASVTLDNSGGGLSGIYRHLEIYWVARTDNAGPTGQTLLIRFNGDTGGNYDQEHVRVVNATMTGAGAVAGTSIRVGSVPPSSAPAGFFASGKISVPYYSTTTQDKVVISDLFYQQDSNATTQQREMDGGVWRTANAAITSVTLFPGSDNFVENSRFSLYGVR